MRRSPAPRSASTASLERESAAGPRERGHDAIVELQRGAGNAAVSALLGAGVARQPAPPVAPPATAEVLPAWSHAQLDRIQRQLRRLGLYLKPIDHIYGSYTRIGLVESFGGEEWRTLEPDVVEARLKAAKAPAGGKKGEHEFRYGEMLKDGLLDLTVGIGFTEETDPDTGNPYWVDNLNHMKAELTGRGFVEDAGRAADLLKASGRSVAKGDYGSFFVNEAALVYSPPAAPPRPVHAVVRVVANDPATGGRGGDAAAAFEQGMSESDVSISIGHGRYGSGPDFDRNFERFDLLDKDGSVEETMTAYAVLEERMRTEGKPHGRGAWQQFLWRHDHHRITVVTSNAGNVFVNPKDLHSGEFGAKLIYWSMQQTGTKPVTGKGGALATDAAAHPEKSYRVLMFDGCRTQDYVKSIRSTPGFDPRSTDIVSTKRSIYLKDEFAALAAFLDGLIHMRSAEGILKDMDKTLDPDTPEGGPAGTWRATGTEDNPVVR
jgi:hypothetical protein